MLVISSTQLADVANSAVAIAGQAAKLILGPLRTPGMVHALTKILIPLMFAMLELYQSLMEMWLICGIGLVSSMNILNTWR